VSPVTLTKAPLVKQGQRRNPVLANPRSKIRSVLRLILPGGELLATPWPGGELLAAPWRGGDLLAAPWALRATPLQSSRKTKPAERRIKKAINGQLLSIRIRIVTVTHATKTNAAQIEFAASQKRQQVTKLDEKEGDNPLTIRLCPTSGAKLLIYRLTVVATLIVVLLLSQRIRFSLQTITESSVVSEASRFAPSVSEASRFAPSVSEASRFARFEETKRGRFAYAAPQMFLDSGRLPRMTVLAHEGFDYWDLWICR
jgi:hypothetical protein